MGTAADELPVVTETTKWNTATIIVQESPAIAKGMRCMYEGPLQTK